MKNEHMFQLFNRDLLKFADLDRSRIILFYPVTIFYLFMTQVYPSILI